MEYKFTDEVKPGSILVFRSANMDEKLIQRLREQLTLRHGFNVPVIAFNNLDDAEVLTIDMLEEAVNNLRSQLDGRPTNNVVESFFKTYKGFTNEV